MEIKKDNVKEKLRKAKYRKGKPEEINVKENVKDCSRKHASRGNIKCNKSFQE